MQDKVFLKNEPWDKKYLSLEYIFLFTRDENLNINLCIHIYKIETFENRFILFFARFVYEKNREIYDTFEIEMSPEVKGKIFVTHPIFIERYLRSFP